MKKNMVKIAVAILLLFAVWNFYKLINPELKTEMVFSGKMENASSHQGVIARDEFLADQSASGTLQAMVPEGEMVKKGKLIACIYKGGIDPDVQNKLTRVNERISEITSSKSAGDAFSDDVYKLETRISEKVKEMVASLDKADARTVLSDKLEIDAILEKKNTLTGDKASIETSLAALEAEKSEYESVLNQAREDIFSPRAGIFSTLTDGLESVLSTDAAKEMTVDEFRSILDTPLKDTTAADYVPQCKIIDTYEWCVAMELTEARAKQFEENESVELRLDGISKNIPARVSAISPVKDGKCILTASSSYYDTDIVHMRKTEVTLIKNTYSGLKVPVEAIREKDGEKGVYTVTDSFIRFKPVEVLYQDGEYAIVKENNAVSGSLLLYDEVVVAGRNLTEGKMVK